MTFKSNLSKSPFSLLGGCLLNGCLFQKVIASPLLYLLSWRVREECIVFHPVTELRRDLGDRVDYSICNRHHVLKIRLLNVLSLENF